MRSRRLPAVVTAMPAYGWYRAWRRAPGLAGVPIIEVETALSRSVPIPWTALLLKRALPARRRAAR